jgi:methionyl-tRNA formyltransferase
VHGSLLPRHRGAAPIAAAILAGDEETGITLMRMDPGLDTGPMLAKASERIRPDDTTSTLAERLAVLGAQLLSDWLPAYLAGALPAEPQDERLATYAPQLKKEDGRLDFERPAAELERRVRALQPWPVAYGLWPAQGADEDRPLRVLRAAVLAEALGAPGTVVATPGGPAVATGEGALLLLEVQPPGKRPMPAADFARGARDFVGTKLV